VSTKVADFHFGFDDEGLDIVFFFVIRRHKAFEQIQELLPMSGRHLPGTIGPRVESPRMRTPNDRPFQGP
jgi:hypothetical protein